MQAMFLFSEKESFFEPFQKLAETESVSFRAISSIPALLEQLYRIQPDTLFIRIPKDDCASIALLFRINMLPLEHPLRLFLSIDRAMPIRMPIDVLFCFREPFDPKMAWSIMHVLSESPLPIQPSKRLEDRLCSESLLQLGVSPRLQGFEMLRLGALYLLHRPTPTDVSIMYELYPAIAKHTGTSISIVEHAMRHAIESAWMRADIAELQSFIGYTTKENKPTPSNSAFLCLLTERIRMRLQGTSYHAIAKEMQQYGV